MIDEISKIRIVQDIEITSIVQLHSLDSTSKQCVYLWLMTETKILPMSGGVAKCHALESLLRALELLPLKHGKLSTLVHPSFYN